MREHSLHSLHAWSGLVRLRLVGRVQPSPGLVAVWFGGGGAGGGRDGFTRPGHRVRPRADLRWDGCDEYTRTWGGP